MVTYQYMTPLFPSKYSQYFIISLLCLVWHFLITAGVLITGGDSKGDIKAEVFNPVSGNSCPVQDIPDRRFGHSSCSNLLCGGGDSSSSQSCLKITGTDISPLPSLTLRKLRWYHLCWSLPGDNNNILLLGGYYSPTTTELVSETESSDSFTLEYKTK